MVPGPLPSEANVQHYQIRNKKCKQWHFYILRPPVRPSKTYKCLFFLVNRWIKTERYLEQDTVSVSSPSTLFFFPFSCPLSPHVMDDSSKGIYYTSPFPKKIKLKHDIKSKYKKRNVIFRRKDSLCPSLFWSLPRINFRKREGRGKK